VSGVLSTAKTAKGRFLVIGKFFFSRGALKICF